MKTRPTIYGQPIIAAIHYMGKAGLTLQQAAAVLKDNKIPVRSGLAAHLTCALREGKASAATKKHRELTASFDADTRAKILEFKKTVLAETAPAPVTAAATVDAPGAAAAPAETPAATGKKKKAAKAAKPAAAAPKPAAATKKKATAKKAAKATEKTVATSTSTVQDKQHETAKG